MKADQWAAAADKFRASDRAEPSVGAKYSLGDCYLRLGKTASAWASYREAANLAAANKDNRRLEQIRKKAAGIKKQLTFVRIDVPEVVAGLEIQWDLNVHRSELWGQRFPVDPGPHTISASAKGFQRWSQEIRTLGPGEQVDIRVPRLKRLPASARPAEHGGLGTTRKLALGALAVGVLGVAGGSVLGLSARSKNATALDDHCDSQFRCDAMGVELVADAKARRTQSLVALAIGGLGVTAAAALWFLPQRASEDQVLVGVAADPETALLQVTGRF